MSLKLQTVERETGPEPTTSVIWLHGLGADGYDFDPIVPALRIPGGPETRYVFPHAPVRPVTINGGMEMRAWYDIYAIQRGAREDVTGIRESAEAVTALIEREAERGIPAERLVLAGFSQGGAVALHAGLRYPHKLAGIIGLSTYLPLKAAAGEFDAANRDTPLFMAHGSLDPVVPSFLGQESAELLVEAGYQVEYKTYVMPHAVCPEEVEDIRNWLRDRFTG
ncbi:MAG: carboxylesterase [Gammaproteobacteria bacterium]|jgi:phospholipase/carboxylesterase